MSEAALHLLSNGKLGVLLSPAGGGFTAFCGLALTRWAPDPTRDADGYFVYLRDLDSGEVWSAGLQPLTSADGSAEATFSAGRAELRRTAGELELRTEVAVAPDADVELRRITITNRGDRARRLEVTTYAEVVLNTASADAGHPAFSKLFVQTAYDAGRGALLAWRRLRSPDDEPLWLYHTLQGGDGAWGAPELETDRARFLGRGRTPADPRVLDAGEELSGTVGNVLDPILSLRRRVAVGTGESVTVTAVLGAGRTQDSVASLADRFASAAAVEAVFAAAEAPPAGAVDALGLPDSWLGQLTIETDRSWRAAPVAVPAPPGGANRTVPAAGDGTDGEPLLFFNGYGGFTEDGNEYVIRLDPGPEGPRRPPLPWINVIANEEAGFLVSESGAGYTWSLNSRENRLTPWFNDPVTDPHGEALYLRDEESGRFWSPTPGPAPDGGAYVVRHGFGYTRVLHENDAISQEVTCFMPRRDPVKIVRLRIANTGDLPRRLSATMYLQWVLGVVPQESRGDVVTWYDEPSGALLARNPNNGEFADRVAFAAVIPPRFADVSFTTDRAAFLGPFGTCAAPAALVEVGPLDGRADDARDPCAAFRGVFDLPAGEETEVAFLIGQTEVEDGVRILARRYSNPVDLERALEEVRGFWGGLLGRVRVTTPSRELDLMVNGWLAYQNLVCRLWARSAFHQSGGAFGFRDQLQDAAGFVYLMPAITRRQIVLHAAHQFEEGDVMHWWHPPSGKGIRTRFSDDLLWLPYVTAQYVRTTGDSSVLNVPAPFLTARELEPEEDEAFLVPQSSGRQADVYEHCCRAIDRSLTRGSHGLPLIGTGDWNDGMNRVGRAGKGESVWLGFFLYTILEDFLPFVRMRGEDDRAERYRFYREELGRALNDGGWDGGWYRRAYYDNGAPLGSAANDECRIDAIAQAWAVLSGAAPVDRAEQTLDAMEQHLVSEHEGLIRLLTPAFDRTPHDPGYIKGYLPGVRENGGQYTHAAIWAVRALAEAGRTERVAPLLEMLSPVSHGRTAAEVETYRVEPYVIAADVYGVEPHVGRGGWTWYTGSAGWMYRTVLESLLGFTLQDGEQLLLRPCLPSGWPGFVLQYRLPDERTTYRIDVGRAADGEPTVASLDGRPVTVEGAAVVIPLARDGAEHRLTVALGSDLEIRYVPR